MYESKSRVVPFDKGAIGDLLRYPNATQLPKNAANTALLADEAYWLNQYFLKQGLRSLGVSPQLTKGAESIEGMSTGKDHENPCLHVKSRPVNHPYLTVRDYGSYNYLATWYYRQATYNYTPWFLKDVVLSQVDIQAARSRAWNNMLPRFEGKVSTLNFLFELKDFRDIAKHIFKKDEAIKILRSSFTKLKKSRKPSLRPLHSGDPTAAFASGILINNFAVQPLIKDLTDMFQQANIIVREAQQAFNDAGSELQSSHFSEVLERNGTLVRGTGNNAWFGDGEHNFTKFTATLRYKYDYTMRDTVDAWMKYWGLCGSFEAFWNALPFSFLVDYFVQIGNSIHAMEHDPNVSLHEYGYCESIKTIYQKGKITMTDPLLRVLIINDKVEHTQADHVLSGLEGSIYHRWPTTPYRGIAVPKLKIPTTGQFTNMAALLRCLL